MSDQGFSSSSSLRHPFPIHSSSTAEMHQMLEKYSKFTLPASVSSVKRSEPQGHVILVTGTTGALGSYLLDGFLRDETVSRVYTFNRRGPTSKSMFERHVEEFTEKRLGPSVFRAYQGKWVILEGDLTKENFGLEEDDFLELSRKVTTIVHNAWTVNFTAPLQYFESQIEAGSKLLSFSLASPQRRAPSSYSLYVHHSAELSTYCFSQEGSTRSRRVGIRYRFMMGKWVVEQLLSRASQVSLSGDKLRTMVVRVGQLCRGDNGSWTSQEWFPSIIITGVNLGIIPSCTESCANWLTYTLAARAYIDFAKHPIRGHQVAHLVHPRPICWDDVTSEIARELRLPMIPMEDWITAVQTVADRLQTSTPLSHSQTSTITSNSTPASMSESSLLSPTSTADAKDLTLKTQRKKYPIIKLLPYIGASSLYAEHTKPLVDCQGVPILDMRNAMAFSPAMRDDQVIPMLDAKDMVGKWLVHWGLKKPEVETDSETVGGPSPLHQKQTKDLVVARL